MNKQSRLAAKRMFKPVRGGYGTAEASPKPGRSPRWSV